MPKNWYKVNELQFRVFSGLVVVVGMLVIIITRTLLLYLKKTHEITLALYIWLITAEVILMATFYTSFEKFILNDGRGSHLLFLNAIQKCGAHTVDTLFIKLVVFSAWTDIKGKTRAHDSSI